MTITLPLPSSKLSPNARLSWRGKARLTKQHRTRAMLAALAATSPEDRSTRFSSYSLTFYFPDARKRDDDNAAASCKAYRDGIADALGIDDHTLPMNQSPTILIDRENPRLEFHLHQ